MPSDNAAAWDAWAEAHQAAASPATDAASYGPDIPDEGHLRLLGEVRGKRVLDLGCGGGQAAVAFARAGAAVIAVDHAKAQLAAARRLAEAAEVRLELRHADVADLGWLRAGSIDAAYSAYTLGFVADLARLFRQVHRVLRSGSPLVFSVAHPSWAMVDDRPGPPAAPEPAGAEDGTGGTRPVVRRSYFDQSPMVYERSGATFTEHHHTFGELYMALARASYRVDTILEPEPVPGAHRSDRWRPAQALVPRTLIVRARKEGS